MPNPNPKRNLGVEINSDTGEKLGPVVSTRIPLRLMDQYRSIPDRSVWLRTLIVEALKAMG